MMLCGITAVTPCCEHEESVPNQPRRSLTGSAICNWAKLPPSGDALEALLQVRTAFARELWVWNQWRRDLDGCLPAIQPMSGWAADSKAATIPYTRPRLQSVHIHT